LIYFDAESFQKMILEPLINKNNDTFRKREKEKEN
jgi:hypothetical protein